MSKAVSCSQASDFKITPMLFDLLFLGKGFLGEGRKDLAKERDKKSFALKEVDLAKVSFVSGLREDETSIKGEEKLYRLKENGNIRLGANIFMALWKDYETNGENSILKRAYQAGIIGNYIDFFGNVFLDWSGGRLVLSLYCDDDGSKWKWATCWLEGVWGNSRVSAILLQD